MTDISKVTDKTKRLLEENIEQSSLDILSVLKELRELGLKNPMEMNEIDELIAESRKKVIKTNAKK